MKFSEFLKLVKDVIAEHEAGLTTERECWSRLVSLIAQHLHSGAQHEG